MHPWLRRLVPAMRSACAMALLAAAVTPLSAAAFNPGAAPFLFAGAAALEGARRLRRKGA